jgi:protein TonB
LFALLHMSGKIDLADPQSVLRVFDVSTPPPPQPPPPPAQQRQQSKPKEKEGGSAPKNIKSEATPVVAPPPKIETPRVQQIAASETPRQGTAPTQGASDVRGPGTGAGGVGTGTGSGLGGNGPGGGGTGGLATTRTRLARPPLSGREFPNDLLDSWPRGGWVFARFRVDANGVITECIVDRSSGSPTIDSAVCNIARERLRFRPALNKYGQRVADWFAYGQRPPR